MSAELTPTGKKVRPDERGWDAKHLHHRARIIAAEGHRKWIGNASGERRGEDKARSVLKICVRWSCFDYCKVLQVTPVLIFE
ncbi:hypothetical protein ZHAS_00005660 [Anopheles sinensis]|uniref:Uncharacterized protein n=1 Tax=Anopheles sinensis TaxID=74873 RepID=A0A084VK19_ANOSI|nr:hypothetical protein ZHAS_00005660 [Anopheles sinensis]